MFDPSKTAGLEFRSPREIREVRNDLLRRHLDYLAGHSPFYQRLFLERGIDPPRIRRVEDLPALPFTAKADLEAHNLDLLCVSESLIVDVCQTSGTTGIPVSMLQTASDLERLAYNEEISFRAAGITAADRVLIAAAIDRCFMAGLAYFLGLTRIGAMAIRAGSASISFLTELVRRHRPTAIVGVPTLVLAAAERLSSEGDDPGRLGVKRIICIGEPVRNEDLSLSRLGERLKRLWKAAVLTTYASTEMASAFADCEAGTGGHVHPDLIIAEIVDDEGRPLPPGRPGEVVATPLQVTGMPLLRFLTGDVATLHDGPCPCGRNSPRLGPVIGRKSQMLKVKGTTVYPPAIFAVLQELETVRGSYIEVHDDYELSDRIRVVIGTTDKSLTSEAVAERIAARIRVRPEVVLAAPEEIQARTIQEGKRKAVTFFDCRRKKGE